MEFGFWSPRVAIKRIIGQCDILHQFVLPLNLQAKKQWMKRSCGAFKGECCCLCLLAAIN